MTLNAASLARLQFRFFLAIISGFVSLIGSKPAQAQRAEPRIRTTVENSVRAAVTGSQPPRARLANDAGRVPDAMKIAGASIVFNRSAAQQADLDALLAAQQSPASPLYHQWLTPDAFAVRFGMADSDLAAVTSWLQSQGLIVDGVSRGRDRITFTGTAAQIAAAFQSELHYFKSGPSALAQETHFAPAGDLTVPAAFAGSIQAVSNLSDFRPRPHVRAGAIAAPRFNSGQTGAHFVQPGDLAAIYDIKAAYNAGYTGAGQSIAVVGQSAVILADVAAFQAAAGTGAAAPTLILQPNTGAPTIYSGDEGESDLDLEYTAAIARGASTYFVYTGASPNYGVFDAMSYAITNRIAPIISVSYGECETALGQAAYTSYVSIFQQAAAQGQTVIASSGDDGSTDCYQFTSLLAAQRTALAVDFPSDSPYVTGLGGTEFLASAVTTANTQYWAANTSSDIISSALSYIPEQVWNDGSASGGLASGGGGVSQFAARPSYQSSSVPGIAAIGGSFRLVPDLALDSSPVNAGFLYCSSDSGSTSIQGSCTNGFRDATNTYLTVAGGTSFAAPVFAGMLAIINQATRTTYQGQINPILYTLASNATTYASAFHDITSGTNSCTAGSTYCTTAGTSGYNAATGYDEATGLGSVDLFNLLTAWPTAAASTVAATTTTIAAATTVPALAATDTVTITVARTSGTSTVAPTGTITLTINGGASTTLPLTNGSAAYSFSSTTAGQFVLVATYSGDANYAASTGTLLLQAGSTGSFSLSASSPTVTSGNNTTSTVTVTPANGYSGTVAFTVSASPTISNACYTVNNATVSGTTPATATITIITNQANCGSATTLRKGGAARPSVQSSTSSGGSAASHAPAKLPPSTPAPLGSAPVGIALAGLAGVGLLGRRSRALRAVAIAAFLSLLGFGISGCGSGVTSNPLSGTGTTTTTAYAPVGSYTIVVHATDTANANITSYASFTLKIQ